MTLAWHIARFRRRIGFLHTVLARATFTLGKRRGTSVFTRAFLLSGSRQLGHGWRIANLFVVNLTRSGNNVGVKWSVQNPPKIPLEMRNPIRLPHRKSKIDVSLSELTFNRDIILCDNLFSVKRVVTRTFSRLLLFALEICEI
jgi:hypothetical protein